MQRIYLDHATTTPLAMEVREAMRPYLDRRFGNPSSPHRGGREAREGIESARVEVAALLGSPAEEIVFTGSATESNNWALKGVALASGRGHIVAAATEHISILHPLRTLARRGFRVSLIPVDPEGRVDPDRLESELAPDTVLVSIAHGTAEIGTLQMLDELCRRSHAHGVPVHTDATLTAGLLPWRNEAGGPDLITLTPHLFHGPKGVGALRIRRGLRLAPLIEGGGQEGGLRAGTEAVAAIVGFGAAARLAARAMPHRGSRAASMMTRLGALLSAKVDRIRLTGHPTDRVPGLLSLCVGGVEAEALVSSLEAEGIDAASGSACTTEVHKPSHVLEAIAIEPVLARGALTLMFGECNRDDDPERVSEILPAIVKRLRALSPFGAD